LFDRENRVRQDYVKTTMKKHKRNAEKALLYASARNSRIREGQMQRRQESVASAHESGIMAVGDRCLGISGYIESLVGG
jgi:hypothetical protein